MHWARPIIVKIRQVPYKIYSYIGQAMRTFLAEHEEKETDHFVQYEFENNVELHKHILHDRCKYIK